MSPEIETGKSVPGVAQTSATFSKIEKIRLLSLPLIARLAAPGPVIVSGPLMFIWPDVSTIVPVTVKSIVSAPAAVLACETASRRLPGPLSLVLVTVKVAAQSGPASDANSDATIKCFMRFSPGLMTCSWMNLYALHHTCHTYGGSTATRRPFHTKLPLLMLVCGVVA